MEIAALLKLMVQRQGSDLFITAGRPPCLKLHGVIKAISKHLLTDQEAREIVFSVMNDKIRREFDATKEANFAINPAKIGRFRVSAFIQRDQVGMVIRRIESQIPTFKDLQLPPKLREIAMLKRGLVAIVGATGSGKSSTLAAMVGHRNRHSTSHIISIEDPIEFVHEHQQSIVTQREVGIDTESYEVALKNTLRQAPDVILIGEVRTRETMEYAIAFAETGHLVLTTLHASNAYSALDRIINFFPKDRRDQLLLDLSLNLRAVIAQDLIQQTDGKGRVPAVEILINTPLVQDMIRKGDIHKMRELMRRSGEEGMMTFDQSLFILHQNGLISYDDALTHADSANEVRLMIKLDKENSQLGGRLQDELPSRLLLDDG
ncbi:MAG: type IV pili twitching motility protein PilT [Gammaproteobacteria bacterium RIFOXYA12_FULL_61_12]|nr:MAG: type IV pili twitching motility protein PilT [Gammaproteobacteria bacterium RIFOXYD12_FULL_61_37]OGT91592.1 MAG: type IV pili twitching motility protein PilT [Gammaproteobacteria bacterium RIFOXYA12_FULL_61_12]